MPASIDTTRTLAILDGLTYLPQVASSTAIGRRTCEPGVQIFHPHHITPIVSIAPAPHVGRALKVGVVYSLLHFQLVHHQERPPPPAVAAAAAFYPADARSNMESNRGVWSEDEHDRFLEAIQIYPHGPWRCVAEYVGTRDVRQVQTHAQKYYEKINRHVRGLRKERRSWVRPEHRIEDLPLPAQQPAPPPTSLASRLHDPGCLPPIPHYIPREPGAFTDASTIQHMPSFNARSLSVPNTNVELPTLEESLDILLECLSDY